MADSDAEFRIRATIDPSGADAGAAQVAADLDKVKGSTDDAADAAEKGATGFNKMVTEAGGLRESTRLGREFFEVIRGGDESIAGLSGIARFVLVASEALGPLGPIAGAVAALGLSFASVWAMHEQKSGEANDKVKGDLDDTGKAVDALATRWTAALELVLQSQKELEASDRRQLDMIEQKAKGELAVMQVQKEAAIEQARTAYLAKLDPEMSPEARKKLKDQFQAQVSDINDESEVATSALAVTTQKQKIAQQQKDLDDAKAALGQDKAQLAARTGQENDALALVAQQFAAPDAEGNFVMPSTSDQHKAAHEMKADALQRYQGVQEYIKRAKEDIDAYFAAGGTNKDYGRDEMEGFLAALNESQGQINYADRLEKAIGVEEDFQKRGYGEQMKDVQEKIVSQAANIQDLQDKLDEANQQLGLLSQKADVAKVKLSNDQTERGKNAEADANDQAIKDFQKKKEEQDREMIRAGEEANRKKKAQEEADAHATAQGIEAVHGQIAATGNRALIEQARRIMETVLDKHQELVELQTLFANGVNEKFSQIDQKHADLSTAVYLLK